MNLLEKGGYDANQADNQHDDPLNYEASITKAKFKRPKDALQGLMIWS